MVQGRELAAILPVDATLNKQPSEAAYWQMVT
jgi:hypothetical protein